MCIWHTSLCEFAIGVQCMFVYFVCVFVLTFAFHLAACLCVSIINGAAKYSHHTHFILLLLNYVCYELCVQHNRRLVSLHTFPLTFPIHQILQQVLRVVCADNPQHRNGKYTGIVRVGRVG